MDKFTILIIISIAVFGIFYLLKKLIKKELEIRPDGSTTGFYPGNPQDSLNNSTINNSEIIFDPKYSNVQGNIFHK